MKTYESILNALNNDKPELARTYLLENIREEGAKKAGAKTSDFAIIKRLMKDNEKGRLLLNYDNPFTVEGTTYHCFMNSFYAVCNTTQDYGFGPRPDGTESSGYIIKRCVEGYITGTNGAVPANIDLNDVAAAAAVVKADKDHGYFSRGYIFHVLENGKHIAVDPRYFLDCIKYVGADARVYVTTPSSAIYIENSDKSRVAMIMPVRVQDIKNPRWQFASTLK